jgi:hypothetical protein
MTHARLLTLAILAAVTALATKSPSTADHRDGPIITPPGVNARSDFNDLYVFKATPQSRTTTIIMTMNPMAGLVEPTTFLANARYEVLVDADGDAAPNTAFRITFAQQTRTGAQELTVTGADGRVRARGLVGQTVTLDGGGRIMAGVFDDPFFFDAAAVGAFLRDGNSPVPRAVNPRNFFQNANTLAFVIEIPTAQLLSSPNETAIGVYLRDEVKGVAIDRTGQPAINTGLIPPVPRVDSSRGDRRNAFNAGLPVNDPRDFRDDAIFVLSNANPNSLFQRDPATAAALVDFLLPDVLKYDTSQSAAYPNGRTLRDDVIDTTLQIITGAAGLTDGVPDDNGDRITDGTQRPDGSTRPAIFPYLGIANLPAGLPNP